MRFRSYLVATALVLMVILAGCNSSSSSGPTPINVEPLPDCTNLSADGLHPCGGQEMTGAGACPFSNASQTQYCCNQNRAKTLCSDDPDHLQGADGGACPQDAQCQMPVAPPPSVCNAAAVKVCLNFPISDCLGGYYCCLNGPKADEGVPACAGNLFNGLPFNGDKCNTASDWCIMPTQTPIGPTPTPVPTATATAIVPTPTTTPIAPTATSSTTPLPTPTSSKSVTPTPAKPTSTATPGGFACPKTTRLLKVVNSATQPIWVAGGGGALRALCVTPDTQCIPEEGQYGKDFCFCNESTGYVKGSLACPGTSLPTSNGKNCSAMGEQNCGATAGANTDNHMCFFLLPKPSRLTDPANNNPETWNWELDNTDEADFCLPPASVTTSTGTADSEVWWSGGVSARTGCLKDGTGCATGDCTTCIPTTPGNCAPLSNSNCPAGKGPAIPFTIAEFTLQRTQKDFYDITVINGANIAEVMAPVPAATGTPGSGTNAADYWCQAAGALHGAVKGKNCNWNFGSYIKEVPLTTGKQDFTALLMNTVQPCTVGISPSNGCPVVGPTPSPTPALTSALFSTVTEMSQPAAASPTPVPYSCNPLGNPPAPGVPGICVKTCVANADCPSNLHCLPAPGQSLKFCQCEAESDCASQPTHKYCGSRFIPGVIGSVNELFIQECGDFAGWWSADDFCGNPSNQNGPIDCSAHISGTNLASLFGCNGAGGGDPNNAMSCYIGTPKSGCCGCATDSSNDLFGDWPPDVYPENGEPGSCLNNNKTWASEAQPWLANLKQACPTAYSFPYDDFTSTFNCQLETGINALGYSITFSDLAPPGTP